MLSICRKGLVLVSVVTGIMGFAALADDSLSLIPRPAKIERAQGVFVPSDESCIVYEGEDAKAEAEILAEMLRPASGLSLKVKKGKAAVGDIFMSLDVDAKWVLGDEGYILGVTESGVTIKAATTAGLFYGGQTLRQLLQPEIYAKIRQDLAWSIPCCLIEDKPRFVWRGFMLDYSRHFFGVAYTKHLLDAMAMNKLNVFHMHLTDDDGWRIEIKKYPKLTEIGGWRGTECVLPNTRKGETFKRYGGFLSQDDIREIVAYAAKLHISVMPEIDLPGHCLAVCTAYPETLPSKMPDNVSVQGHKSNAISPAKESNYEMVDDIIGEIAEIFPFEYVHIGGDEVNHSLWKECPEIKSFMAENKIGNMRGAQVHFTKRLEVILADHNKKMIGWNEIMNDKLEHSTGIMSWIGTGPGYHAAKRGFPVVMAPGPHAYFDMPYVGAYDEPPAHWWAGPVDSARCYAFDPLGDPGLNAEQSKKIIGIHSCLWSEYVTPWKSKSGWMELPSYDAHADYKAFPRLCALAEIGWTPQAKRDFAGFADRLGPTHLRRLKAAGVTVRVPITDAVIRKGLIHILPPFANAEVRYTVDGSDPFDSDSVLVWDGKPIKGAGSKFRARTYLDGQPSPLHVGAKLESVGKWSSKIVKIEFEEQSFDLTGALDEPGVWRIGFRKTGGKHHLAVSRVDVVIDGKVVARDIHEGGSADKGKYRFNINDMIPASAKVVARIRMKAESKGEKKIKTAGDITLEKSEYLEPTTVVSSAVSQYGGHGVANLTDYDHDTFFWSSRAVRKGEAFVFSFAEPLILSSIESVSGKINDPTKDTLLNGILEISADGEHFRKVADFSYGAAKIELKQETVKAIRVMVTADHSDMWLVLQDLLLK